MEVISSEMSEAGDSSGDSVASWDSNDSNDSDAGFGDYYSFNDDEEGRASQFNNNDDPEYFSYECLTVANVEKIFNDSIETVQASLGVTHARAKQILHSNKWNIPDILDKHTPRVPSPSSTKSPPTSAAPAEVYCPVCASNLPSTQFASPKGCGHSFCCQCWEMHCETQIGVGVSTSLSCMAPGCDILVEEDLVLGQVKNVAIRERYKHLCFIDYVRFVTIFKNAPQPFFKTLIAGATPT